MSPDPLDVVFDCNVFLQAMLSAQGPAAECLRIARAGELTLFVSDYVLAEIRDLPNDRKLANKFQLTVEKAERFIAEVVVFARPFSVVPEVYRHAQDPDDSHYVNLAIATGATFIVSRDRHLLNLMDAVRGESQEFQQRFPTIRVLAPETLLRLQRAR
jgi:putative PIN family toxin of toxin-antitoxin system